MSTSPKPSSILPTPLSVPSNGSSTRSNSELASMLTTAYEDAENLQKQLNNAIRRAERAERSLAAINPSASNTLYQDLESRLEKAEVARDEAEARRARIQEYWHDFEKWLNYADAKIQENRLTFSRVVSENGGQHLNLVRLPLVNDLGSPSSQNYPMSPPLPTGRHSHPQVPSRTTSLSRGATFGALPLPPAPNPRIRQREENLTGPGVQPLPKKHKTDGERRSMEEGVDYSESPNSASVYFNPANQTYPQSRSPSNYPPFPQHYPPPPSQVEITQAPAQHSVHRASRSHHQHLGGRNRSNSSSHSDSRSRSRSRSRESTRSKSIDDMILETAEGGAVLTRRASMDPQSLATQHSKRGDNPEQYTYPRTDTYPSHLAPHHSQSPHRPHSQSSSRPRLPQSHSLPSYPPESSGSAGNQVGGTVQTYQTHIFAPVVTGAPVKKIKFSQAGIALPTNGSATHPSASNPANTASGSAPTTGSTYPPTNAQGQRICRQCGQTGRYKEGKCVEKWGPGPEGPGTCCDRCRKKMKRFERRGTHEASTISSAIGSQVPQQRLPHSHSLVVPSESHRRSPISPSRSDRGMQRAETLATPLSAGAVRPSGTLILTSAHDNERERTPSTRSLHQASLSPQAAPVDSGEEAKRTGGSGPDERDQRESTPEYGGSKHGSPRPGLEDPAVDPEDADVSREVDLDAGADPDADLLEAVDAAEANGAGSAGTGWLKEEDVSSS